jgi:hypothetical protein
MNGEGNKVKDLKYWQDKLVRWDLAVQSAKHQLKIVKGFKAECLREIKKLKAVRG